MCWYCETKDSRSDNAVDHFRPKGRVAGESTHTGYWWPAFDWNNLRFSCTYCNGRRRDIEHGTAGGKQDEFPLAEGSKRAESYSDRLDDEVPLLLDPCWLSDVDLLWFDDSGQVQPNPSSVFENSLRALRVKASREIYHLDHVRLIRERKRVYRAVHRLMRRVDFAWKEWQRVQDEATQRNYEELLLQVRQFVVRESQHSAAARCALLGYRSDSGAISAVLRFL